MSKINEQFYDDISQQQLSKAVMTKAITSKHIRIFIISPKEHKHHHQEYYVNEKKKKNGSPAS